MDFSSILRFSLSLLIVGYGGLHFVKLLLKRVNPWIYETKLSPAVKSCLPPGDMGWPLIGNMWSFLTAFRSHDPDSFMRSFVSSYGGAGVYKGFMFGKPCVFVTTSETCKRVLNDDEAFTVGWPLSTVKLMGRKSFIGDISYEEHKRLRRLTAAPINGPTALSIYIRFIDNLASSSLETWADSGPIEFLTHVRKLTFQIITHIFISSEGEAVMKFLEAEYTALNYGVRAMAINLPGFAFHRALKARRKLVAILQTVVTTRRLKREADRSEKDMMDILINVEDDDGRKLTDEEIIDILLMYLNAGHESSGHTMMWAVVYIQEHPEIFRKAKEEQEQIVKRRPDSQNGISLKEIREMEYLPKVIDETQRLLTFSSMVFRQAKKDVEINGYTIPEGWRAIVWFRSVHLDPEVYPSPQEFKPERWKNYTTKSGTFLPFGGGTRLCPGNDLAKIEIVVFLHHFLLNYRLERVDPNCPVMYLPHTRPRDNCLALLKRSH